MIPLRVERSESARPVPGEVRHLLVEGLGSGETSGVLLEGVDRRSAMQPGGSQARFAVVCGVGQAPLHLDVRREGVPGLPEHLAFVNIRIGQCVAQDEERIDFDDRVQLDPVLPRLDPIFRLPPRALPAAEAGSVGGRHDRSSRQPFQDEEEELLPQRQPASGGVLSTKDREVWNTIQLEIVRQQDEETFRLAEGRVEELTDQERDKEITFPHRRPAGVPAMLPERELVGMLPDRFQRQSKPVDHDLVVVLGIDHPAKVDAERVDLRLTQLCRNPRIMTKRESRFSSRCKLSIAAQAPCAARQSSERAHLIPSSS